MKKVCYLSSLVLLIKYKKICEDKNKNNVEDQMLKKNKRIPSVSHDRNSVDIQNNP
jgi:hypothetical protein